MNGKAKIANAWGDLGRPAMPPYAIRRQTS